MTSRFNYCACGLSLASSLPLPCVDREITESEPDVHIHLAPAENPAAPFVPAWYESSYRDSAGNPTLRIWRNAEEYFLLYSDGASFKVRDRSIEARWFAPGTFENAVAYLLGPVLALVLRLCGRVCLHASAVHRADAVIAFLGPPEAGKSTLAAALLRRGWQLVSDDLVPVRWQQGWRIDPSYPGLRLWPRTAASIYGSDRFFPRSSPTWEKCLISADGLTAGEWPLAAIFILAPRHSASPCLEQLCGANALMALVENTYLNYLPCPLLQGRALATLARLTEDMPVFRLTLSDDLGRLASAAEFIETQVAGIRGGQPLGPE